MILDVYEVVFLGEKLGPVFHFFRAIAVCTVLYAGINYIEEAWKNWLIWFNMRKVLIDSSVFSLQFYLFNGYLLTVIRILICSILKIQTPLIIVVAIWIGNIAITLWICKYILPKFPRISRLCGIY